MNKILFIVIAICTIAAASFAQSDIEIQKEKTAIKNIIQTAYVEGLQNEGDFFKIDKGFHPSFKLIGIGQGNEIWEYPIYTWKERVRVKKEKGEFSKKDKKEVSIKFLNVDVTGTAAIAKFEFYVGDALKYVDYLSLYKFEDDWKIVSKIYYQFPEEKR
ncbi:MAG: nuclear transport factor 2 family protein [Bacteroidales bacterium]|nr:nuclear transport factor 2 family protein [Bacteroidales bacterium]